MTDAERAALASERNSVDPGSIMRLEGMPKHPADRYWHCGCDKCEARWQVQLSAYLDALPKRPAIRAD